MIRDLQLVLVSVVVLSISACASDRFDPVLLKSVVWIQTSNEHGGGGFLVSTTEDNSGKTLLITNKHMIGDWNYADANFTSYARSIDVFFYRHDDPSGATYRSTRIELMKGEALDGARVHLHSMPRIDLVAIDISDKVRDPKEHIALNGFAPSFLIPFSNVQGAQTDIADQVIALGYPLGIRSLRNDYPIVKMGYVASTPGEDVSIPIRETNRVGVPVDLTVDGKFLVVDGLIVNGNSGGPVVLAGGVRVRRDPVSNQLQFTTTPVPNFVCGVVSYALGGGLTLVVSSDYVSDLIQTFVGTAKN